MRICERGSWSSRTVKWEEILDLLSKCEAFKKDCALCSEWVRTIIQESLIVWTPLLRHSLALYLRSCTILLSSLFVFLSFVRSFFVVMQCAGSVDVCMRKNMAETGGLSFCLVIENCRRQVGEFLNFLLIYFWNCDLNLNERVVSTALMNMVWTA